MVEPFTGEGIIFALSTGLLAAESALTGLARNDLASALATYARSHRRLYRRRAWVNTLLRWLLTTPSRPVRVLRKFNLPPGLVPFLAHHVHAAT